MPTANCEDIESPCAVMATRPSRAALHNAALTLSLLRGSNESAIRVNDPVGSPHHLRNRITTGKPVRSLIAGCFIEFIAYKAFVRYFCFSNAAASMVAEPSKRVDI